jgi:EAL domain-containing protein (putative c-di-GMP-specific phosphodiesterase class I)
VRYVAEALAAAGVPGDRLALEITENATMRDAPRAAAILRDLKHLNVRIAIDDFGQGNSSLSYLRDFPADMLKIDQFFIGGLGREAAHEWIVDGVIALARGLDLALIAEGIEKPEQRDWLLAHGCVYGQGYYLARPAPPEEVLHVLRRRPPGGDALRPPIGSRASA